MRKPSNYIHCRLRSHKRASVLCARCEDYWYDGVGCDDSQNYELELRRKRLAFLTAIWGVQRKLLSDSKMVPKKDYGA
jgi:hypothetical protein